MTLDELRSELMAIAREAIDAEELLGAVGLLLSEVKGEEKRRLTPCGDPHLPRASVRCAFRGVHQRCEPSGRSIA